MRFLRPTSVVACVLTGAVAASCATQPVQRELDSREPAQHVEVRGPVASAPPRVTKLLVVVEENHSLGQMKRGMPFTFRLARKYGYATRYFAIGHPSLPNYIAMAGGRRYGIHNNKGPASHRIRGRSVFGQALARRRSAAVYAQGMPGTCATRSHGRYAVRHNPWPYFVRERRTCRTHDRPMRAFARAAQTGSLPRVGMVIPDLKHDAHDGSLKRADAWFRWLMSKVRAGNDWRSGRLAVVLTADEDDRAHNNRVLAVVIHRSQRHNVVTRRLNHYALTRLYDEVAQLPLLHHARNARSMAKAFGLPVR